MIPAACSEDRVGPGSWHRVPATDTLVGRMQRSRLTLTPAFR